MLVYSHSIHDVNNILKKDSNPLRKWINEIFLDKSSKNLRRKNQDMILTKVFTKTIHNNTYYATVYGCKKGLLINIFLLVSLGNKQKIYLINSTGNYVLFTFEQHFVNRFLERTRNTHCNLLIALTREFNGFPIFAHSLIFLKDGRWMYKSRNGYAIMDKNIFITFITDLSNKQQELYDSCVQKDLSRL